MSKINFVDHKFSASSEELLVKTTSIMLDYDRQGYLLTLRQLYYQMIARDLFPDSWIDQTTGTKNNIKNYKKFGDLVNNGRLAGRLDWDMIEDRARETVFSPCWDSPAQILESAAAQFKIDKWENQSCHVEVMAEKDAVSGILTPVCQRLQVRFTANRGYASSSLFYEVSRRLQRAHDEGKILHVLYLGDHDPSGIDMTRDVEERMNTFTFNSVDINVTRLALNMNQIKEWQPPENPAKDTDTRFEAYRAKYGDSSYELDAVEPNNLAALVESFVFGLHDDDEWNDAVQREAHMKSKLLKLAADADDEDSEEEHYD